MKIFAKEGSVGQLFTDKEMFGDLTRIKFERPTNTTVAQTDGTWVEPDPKPRKLTLDDIVYDLAKYIVSKDATDAVSISVRFS
jgi:hypothetical protein